MNAPLSFIHEIERTIAQSSAPRRADMVRQLTDLLLVNAEQYSDAEIDLIDDVFVRLVVTIEETARAMLAIRLGPYAKAPIKILSALACDDAIDVASPVLIESERLDDAILVECAKTKSQEHLLAISRRKAIAEAVTDVLVERGDKQVVLSTAKNSGAKFSSGGLTILVERSSGDDLLTACVGSRPDIPAPLFERLLDAASATVREKLTAESPHARRQIDRIVDDVTTKTRTTLAAGKSQKYAAAQVLIDTLSQTGQLSPDKLIAFAKAGRFEETVIMLARLSEMPFDIVEQNVKDDHAEFLATLAKAIDLSWDMTETLLAFSAGPFPRSPHELRQCQSAFQRLSRKTARQALDSHRRPLGLAQN